MAHKLTILLFLLTMLYGCSKQNKIEPSSYLLSEQHRPVFHFTPDSMWMNDPNGMVFFKGEYHLFYQYYPDSTVWGPMHWGHAISKDMIKWTHMPIALYPDSLGYIFSGSVVIDWKNTSGFGKHGFPPMVAIFTHHNMDAEKAGRSDFQYQSIAYSIDKGRTWTKYDGNPVIPNPGNIRDFRDPKVIWHNESQKWIMVLAAKDKVKFYASTDLKKWSFESDFGINGDKRLWECPDLFPIIVEGSKEIKWVLVVSMQTGAPNGGTGTSYFVGNFDGHKFTNVNKNNAQQWLDFGTDNYAMVSWSDIPDTDGRRLMMGWMSNWQYAQKVPTKKWRSAMTLPREITLCYTASGSFKLRTKITKEFSSLRKDTINIELTNISDHEYILPLNQVGLYEIEMTFVKTNDIAFLLTSVENDSIKVGYQKTTNQWYIDRSISGKSDFYDGFAARHHTSSNVDSTIVSMQIIIDKASIEMITEDGMVAMTDIFFPKTDMSKIILMSTKPKLNIKSLTVHNIKG
ncbi:MAG: glycoside hydrolase family 32 protein [Saprospiraceae bacterium]|nr:glycoside hydrolase family 32 protein [Saprospiraceae bacterium]